MCSIPCHVLGTVVVVALLLRGATVEAQPATPPISAGPQAQAERLTRDAITAYNAQNYDTAIRLYEQAYQLVKHPLLQFNIGQAHRLAGNLAEAEKYYKRYLELELDPHGERVQTALDMLDWISKQRPAAASAPPPPSASTSTGSSSSASKATEVPEAAPPPPTRTSGTPPSHGQELTGKPPAPLPAGDARVSTGAGRKYHPEQLEPPPTIPADDMERSETYTSALRTRDERVKQARHIKYAGCAVMGLGIVLGTALLANSSEDLGGLVLGARALAVGITGGGVAIYALGERRLSAAKSVAWSPVVGSGFAGVTLAGRLP